MDEKLYRLPVIKDTDNIYESIKKISYETHIPQEHIDFDIIEIKSYIINSRTGDDIEVNKDSRDLIKSLINKEKHFIKQEFTVHFYDKTNEIRENINLNIKIIGNKDLSKIYVSFDTELTYIDELDNKILSEIIKKQIKNGLVVDIFNVDFSLWMNDIISKVRVHGKYDFTGKNYLLSEGFPQIKAVNPELLKFYSKQKIDNDRVDHKQRDFVIETNIDQLLMRYVKPKEGTAGLNCKGSYIDKSIVNDKINMIKFKIGDGVEEIDSEEYIEYFARKKGFLSMENGFLTIKNNLNVREISFKKTGSIQTTSESDIHINIVGIDESLDQIKHAGVETETLEVTGNVGLNANIVAKTVSISGQVHRSSTVTADTIKINRLKGTAKGVDINIDSVEHGHIRGINLNIGVANGGIIIGETIKIKEVKSNTYILASKSIEIESVTGEDNKIIISPYAKLSQYELNEKLLRISSAEVELSKIQEKLNYLVNLLKVHKNAIIELKKKVAYYKEMKISLPKGMLFQVEKHKNLVLETKETNGLLFRKQDSIDQLKLQLSVLACNIEKSFILVENNWSEYNVVIFKVTPGQEIEYKPRLKEKTGKITIIKVNDKFEINIGKDGSNAVNTIPSKLIDNTRRIVDLDD